MGLNRIVIGFIFNLLVLHISGFAQSNYPVSGTVLIRDGKVTKTSLMVQSGSGEVKVPVDINGNFLTYLKWDTNYKLYFSKIGYVTKCVEFSTQLPSSVSKNTIYPYEILVELFPMFPDVDTMFFKNPVARIHYSEEINDFDYDLDYQLTVKRKLEEIKKKYQNWLIQKSKDDSRTISSSLKKNPKEEVVRYQKNVETSKSITAVVPKTTVARKPTVKKEENPFGVPPLKSYYPEGKTVESFQLQGKTVVRIIMKKGPYQKAYFEVKHNWGGQYYFVQESPTYYRSISKYNFDKSVR
ncbi:hypothetical protein [Plebeiibacterium sediminum]|uniref:Carboxypeptidase regulatory-like domain-containing protein n=1 Tax=Plebeiibacterium sediminum TaxID=2992112 RepID=A0AAE3M641_9BACT|nr:hypothetical protein [Plebeiobacterium sediminum]MCW3787641.1 hypothetical protein [Plebeiobacterium sediminum]